MKSALDYCRENDKLPFKTIIKPDPSGYGYIFT